MSQWGANDNITLAAITVDLDGVAVTRASGSIDFTGDEVNVGDVIQIAGVGGAAVVNAINSAQKLNIVSNSSLSACTASGAAIYRLSTMPKDAVSFYGTGANTVLGVDVTEQGVDTGKATTIANTAAHAGWIKLGDQYTDSNSVVRRKNECLVAMSSMDGDEADDETLADS